jgi:hypothetical protein
MRARHDPEPEISSILKTRKMMAFRLWQQCVRRIEKETTPGIHRSPPILADLFNRSSLKETQKCKQISSSRDTENYPSQTRLKNQKGEIRRLRVWRSKNNTSPMNAMPVRENPPNIYGRYESPLPYCGQDRDIDEIETNSIAQSQRGDETR